MKERKLEVYLGERFVGTMAQTADRRVAFAYSEEWLDNGFAISPFSLPMSRKLFVPKVFCSDEPSVFRIVGRVCR